MIGLAAAALPAGLTALAFSSLVGNEGGSSTRAGVTVAALFFGAGAGTGAIVDAMINAAYVIYGQTRRTRRRVTVSPLLSRDSSGVALSPGF